MAKQRYGNWWYKQETDKHGEANGFYQVFYKDGNEPVFTNSNLRATLDYMIDQHIHELERENTELRKRDIISGIIASGTRLYNEFGLIPTREVTTEVYTDEFAELLDELIGDPPNKAKITDEFGDALYTLVMAVQMHLSPAEMHEAISAVLAKNDKKTIKTHMLVNGIIKSRNKIIKQVS